LSNNENYTPHFLEDPYHHDLSSVSHSSSGVSSSSNTSVSSVDIYFDILLWWKKNEHKYPKLAVMAALFLGNYRK
jgi:hypothetical protein